MHLCAQINPHHWHGGRRVIGARSRGAAVRIEFRLLASMVPEAHARVLRVARHDNGFDPFSRSSQNDEMTVQGST